MQKGSRVRNSIVLKIYFDVQASFYFQLCSFDEFGFRVEEEDGPEQNSNKLLGVPFLEDTQHR